MNQKEIIIEVLKKLGGRAINKDIYVLGKYYIGDNSTAQMVENNIRRILNSNPDVFRHPEGVDEGEWELVSYRNEMQELKYKIQQQEEAYNKLMAEESKAAFVNRTLDEAISLYKHDVAKLDIIRQLFHNLGCKEAEEVLDKIISGKEVPKYSHVGDIVLKKETVIDKNYAPNIENHNGGVIGLSGQVSK